MQSKISPSTLLQVDYGQNDVALGNVLTPQDASEQPNIFFVAPDESDYYTLVMVDTRMHMHDVSFVTNEVFGFRLILMHLLSKTRNLALGVIGLSSTFQVHISRCIYIAETNILQ